MVLINELFESIELKLEDWKNVLRKVVESLTAKTAAFNSSQEVSPYALVQEENFHWILNFATLLMEILFIIIIFRNLSMTASIIEIQK